MRGRKTLARTAGLVAALTLGACAGDNSQSARNEVRLTATDFQGTRDGAPEAAPPVPRTPVGRTPERRDDVIVITGAPPVAPKPPEPAGTEVLALGASSPAPLPDAERLLVDQMVGQINGRPVFADEFFRPMDARLRSEAQRLPPREWLAQTRKDIEAALFDKLRDELLLAEFQSTLTPEQKLGVVAFIETVRDDLISGNLGSESIANQRLLETEGLDLESKVEDITQRQFILQQLRTAIGNRVQVSYRDVQLYYEQNLGDFVPAPVARFTLIRAPLDDPARIERIEAALASGVPFDEVAAQETTFRQVSGGKLPVTLTTRDYATSTLIALPELNAALRRLSPGERTPRVDEQGAAWWARLDEIERPAGKSLYEAQLEIEDRLRAQRIREEETRYFAQLFERGSFSDFKDMSRRLLEFAAERYLIQDRAPQVGAAGSP